MNNSLEKAPWSQESPLLRFCRWLFSWRILRRVLIGLASFVTLIALIFAEENWRGKRAWDNYRRALEAKGEHFDFAAFIPKPVPADQNFLLTPFLAPLSDYQLQGQFYRWRDTNAVARVQEVKYLGSGPGAFDTPRQGVWETARLTDWKGWQAYYRSFTSFPSTPQPQEPALDVLCALSNFDPVVKELREASRRPYAVFPLHPPDAFEVVLPPFAAFKGWTQLLRLRASANLEADRPDEALQDLRVVFRFSEALKPEPWLISHLVRIAISAISLGPIWEGLAEHRWQEPQLKELQQQLAAVDLLSAYPLAIRSERAFGNLLLEKMRAGDYGRRLEDMGDNDDGRQVLRRLFGFVPGGWLYQNQLLLNRLHQDKSLPLVDPARHRVYPDLCAAAADPPELRKMNLYNIIARMTFPATSRAAGKWARTQSALDLATTACALERYRLAQGQYPEKLEALIPRYAEKLPTDVINGEPLKYQREPDGNFILYSVGWNQKDDGGTTVFLSKGRSIDYEKGDHVWRSTVNTQPLPDETKAKRQR